MANSSDPIFSHPDGPPCPVVILVTGTQRRGAEVFAEQLSGSMRARGWDVGLLALKDSGAAASIDAEALVGADDPLNLSGLSLGLVRRLRREVVSRRPAVVLAGGGATLKYAALALFGLRRGPKLVYSSIGEPEYWAKSRLKRRLLSALLGRADLITAVSQATAKQLIRSFSVSEARVRVAPTGVPDRFLDIRSTGPSKELRILFIGSLSVEKNPAAAIRAHLEMSQPSHFRLIGDGPLRPQLEAGAHGSVDIVGSVADVAPHLAWADVLVLTSLTEGLPGVALEASAAGVPVVAFDVGGLSEIVEDGLTGLLVEAGDVAGMASALDRLARDRAGLDAMSVRSREKIRGGFLMSDSVARYEAVFGELCGR
ncbi:MAG: glycosyltransferase family 4 protein [Acidimicrobiia bacterium]|nr:glycosyltransferase family 4 protein [Acidimicrobiia bacterium]MDH3462419.1 glycosyltransferase family 4 protein [Acidimicrobiia bacterium]